MTVTMYGITNCDTIKKARKWLEAHQVEYVFHDYRKDGLTASQLSAWCDELGYDALVNRRGTTWRKLPDETKDNLNEATARQVMLDNPAIIKRPLLDTGKERVLGFSEQQYAALFTD